MKTVMRANPGRRGFVAAEGSFHGRTLGILALTGKSAFREPFEPFGIETTFVPYGDADALAEAVGPDTAAVFLEPTLGEAGVVPPPSGYLTAARGICDDAGSLLVIDEVQGGIGRTGQWFAHQHEAVVPDLVTVAKGLGGGLPVGACIGIGPAAEALTKGDHGTTFGGNPVSCAAALAVIDTIESERLLDHVATLGGGMARRPRSHPLAIADRRAWSWSLAGVGDRRPGGSCRRSGCARARLPRQRDRPGRGAARTTAGAQPGRRGQLHRGAARDPRRRSIGR